MAYALTDCLLVLQTRMQAAGRSAGAPVTAMSVARNVVASDGVTGLWKGATPGLVSFLCLCDILTYVERAPLLRSARHTSGSIQ